ncbi:MAG: HRDC domain-containing protein [Xanthomonadales bacterium]|nr:HRDC domain-containing protein [Xanthomonadales bacterium]
MPAELPSQPVADDDVHAARKAVQSARLIDSEAVIENALENRDEAHVIGIDTEFVRERTFQARPGLIQISDGQSVWLLDAVALPQSEALGEVLADAGTTKVLHSVGEDLEVLHAVGMRWPARLFDTQVAAALLGMPLQLRYEHLVKAALDVELEGGKARNDWCKRPLAPALLQYAAEDVIWLPRLKAHLEALLEHAGRLEWLEEDCERILTRARAGDTTPPLSRVKGGARLETPALARLDALARWRESMARERDLPRRFVISDEALIDLAQSDQKGRLGQALGRLPGGQAKRFGPAIESTLAAVDADAYQRPDWIDPLTSGQRDQLREAQKTVREIADELGIEPAVIASKKALIPLIRGERPEWLEGWRGEVLTGRFESASVSILAP